MMPPSDDDSTFLIHTHKLDDIKTAAARDISSYIFVGGGRLQCLPFFQVWPRQHAVRKIFPSSPLREQAMLSERRAVSTI